MHFSSYEFPFIMPRFACATIQEAFGTYWRWHWTSTLLTVINEIMIHSTSSSAIHTGMVCATGFPAMWTRTLGPHHSAINMQRVGSMTEWCPIDIDYRGRQRRRRWQVRRRARRLEVGRCRLTGQGLLGQRRCAGAERLNKRVKPGFHHRHDRGDWSMETCVTKMALIYGSVITASRLFGIWNINEFIFTDLTSGHPPFVVCSHTFSITNHLRWRFSFISHVHCVSRTHLRCDMTRRESNSHHNGTRFLLIYIPGIQRFFI